MTFFYEDRLSSSPFVDSIWHSRGETIGSHQAIADGSWDFIIVSTDDHLRMFVAGASIRASLIPYTPGLEYTGIRIKVGTYMPNWSAADLLDNMVILPQATQSSFWLHDSMLEIPSFDNVEAFIETLVRDGLLKHDPVVDAAQQGDPDASLRSVQRHFIRATGVTQAMLRQIERARYAQTLLLQGKPVVDTVFEAGFTDQPHMTKSLKQFIGRTPGQIARLKQVE